MATNPDFAIQDFELKVDPEDALNTFHHPYSYTSGRSTDPTLAA